MEAEVHLESGAMGRAIAPAGASRGRGEATDLRDTDRLLGFGVARAVESVNRDFAQAIIGMDAADQLAVDSALASADGSTKFERCGGNAAIAISLANAHAAAAHRNQPLWAYLGGSTAASRLPLPEIQIFGGGAHAGRRLDVQDYLVVAVGARDFRTALEWTARVYYAAGRRLDAEGQLAGVSDEGGYWPVFNGNEAPVEAIVAAIEDAGLEPGKDVSIALDVAASEFYRDGVYHLSAEDRQLDADGLADYLLGWVARYPIVMIEDPFDETDVKSFQRFTEAIGDRVQVIGDDLLVTDASRIEVAGSTKLCNTALIKPNQIGTLTGTKQAVQAARDKSMGAVVSARSGESEDVSIAHIAVGWGVSQLKVGSITRSERNAKWNECLRISDSLDQGDLLPDDRQFPWCREC